MESRMWKKGIMKSLRMWEEAVIESLRMQQEGVMELLRLWEEAEMKMRMWEAAVMESRISKKGIMKISRMREEAIMEYVRFYPKFGWWNGGNHRRMVEIPAETGRTRCLPNTSPKCYHIIQCAPSAHN